MTAPGAGLTEILSLHQKADINLPSINAVENMATQWGGANFPEDSTRQLNAVGGVQKYFLATTRGNAEARAVVDVLA